jgi:hypothetical protein
LNPQAILGFILTSCILDPPNFFIFEKFVPERYEEESGPIVGTGSIQSREFARANHSQSQKFCSDRSIRER